MAVPAIAAVAKAAVKVAKSKTLRRWVGAIALGCLVGMILLAALPVALISMVTPSAAALSSAFCQSAAQAVPAPVAPPALSPTQTATVAQIRDAATSVSSDPKAQLAALTAAFAASNLLPPAAEPTRDDAPLGVYQLTVRASLGTGAQLLNPYDATVLILRGTGSAHPGITSAANWAKQPSMRWLATVGIIRSQAEVTKAEATARAILMQENPALTEDQLATGEACGFVPITGDVKALADALLPAISSGKLYGWDGIDQIKGIAAGTATAKCGIDVRVLQIITIAVNNFDSVGISDINRYCTGSLEGAGKESAHYKDGGGHAVDFMALNGRAITGADPASLKLIRTLDPIVPKGARIGQRDVRANAGVSITTVNFTQFSDTPDHLHIDVLFATGGLALPGGGAVTG